MKVAVGTGAISTVMNILNEICLGDHYFKMAVHLRETNFNSTILLNSESWVNLSKTNIEDLESVDKTLIRKFLETPNNNTITCPVSHNIS